jgi:t-SNARE complex subunit (syntaxin)
MCAGGNIMEKTLTEATQLLQRISEGVAMQRDWEEHISGSIEQ